MIIPTSEEINAAHKAVTADGPVARYTIELGILAIKDPHLSEFVESLVISLKASHKPLDPGGPLVRSALIGALIGGLNLGVRIGEQRAKRAAEGTRTAGHPCNSYSPFVSEKNGEWCETCCWTKTAHDFYRRMRHGEAG